MRVTMSAVFVDPLVPMIPTMPLVPISHLFKPSPSTNSSNDDDCEAMDDDSGSVGSASTSTAPLPPTKEIVVPVTPSTVDSSTDGYGSSPVAAPAMVTPVVATAGTANISTIPSIPAIPSAPTTTTTATYSTIDMEADQLSIISSLSESDDEEEDEDVFHDDGDVVDDDDEDLDDDSVLRRRRSIHGKPRSMFASYWDKRNKDAVECTGEISVKDENDGTASDNMCVAPPTSPAANHSNRSTSTRRTDPTSPSLSPSSSSSSSPIMNYATPSSSPCTPPSSGRAGAGTGAATLSPCSSPKSLPSPSSGQICPVPPGAATERSASLRQPQPQLQLQLLLPSTLSLVKGLEPANNHHKNIPPATSQPNHPQRRQIMPHYSSIASTTTPSRPYSSTTPTSATDTANVTTPIQNATSGHGKAITTTASTTSSTQAIRNRRQFMPQHADGFNNKAKVTEKDEPKQVQLRPKQIESVFSYQHDQYRKHHDPAILDCQLLPPYPSPSSAANNKRDTEEMSRKQAPERNYHQIYGNTTKIIETREEQQEKFRQKQIESVFSYQHDQYHKHHDPAILDCQLLPPYPSLSYAANNKKDKKKVTSKQAPERKQNDHQELRTIPDANFKQVLDVCGDDEQEQEASKASERFFFATHPSPPPQMTPPYENRPLWKIAADSRDNCKNDGDASNNKTRPSLSSLSAWWFTASSPSLLQATEKGQGTSSNKYRTHHHSDPALHQQEGEGRSSLPPLKSILRRGGRFSTGSLSPQTIMEARAAVTVRPRSKSTTVTGTGTSPLLSTTDELKEEAIEESKDGENTLRGHEVQENHENQYYPPHYHVVRFSTKVQVKKIPSRSSSSSSWMTHAFVLPSFF